jgi:regulatory protein NPR1
LVICFTLSTLSSELDDHSYDIFFLLFSVELGRRYFPNCSQVLDKFLEDDLPDSPDALDLQNGTSDEQNVKRMRFCELKEDVRKAFSKDRADNSMFSILSSSSSSSPPPKVAKK